MRTRVLLLSALMTLPAVFAAGPFVPDPGKPRQRESGEVIREAQDASRAFALDDKTRTDLAKEALKVKRATKPGALLRDWIAKEPAARALPVIDDASCVNRKSEPAFEEVSLAAFEFRQEAERNAKGSHPAVEPAVQRRARAFLTLLPDREHLELLGPAVRRLTTRSPDGPDLKTYAGRLEQVFGVYTEPVRLDLVEALACLPGDEALTVLARRAVFDPSPAVRQKAVKELTKADLSVVRPVFLAALRHPLPAAADHAALALVALRDEAALPKLRLLTDQPAPGEPIKQAAGKWAQREVVRIEHSRNCLLCHAPSRTSTGPTRPYYVMVDGRRVRIVPEDDVDPLAVLVRQDFSLIHEEKSKDGKVAAVRYDYVVRERPLAAAEAERHAARVAASEKAAADYPQRQALLWAIRQLGGKAK